nr:heme exporter protein CcmD [Marinomonas mediterranea]
MGTHGVYVWSSYGVFLVSLFALYFYTVRDRVKKKRRLRKRLKSLSKSKTQPSSSSDSFNAPRT